MAKAIDVQVDAEGVARLTVKREEVRNALSREVVDEMMQALDTLEADGVRVLIITGAGDKAFVGGADIRELKARTKLDALRQINSALFRRVERFSAPTIAAINGHALGGGLELALACDLRVAVKTAKLGQPEVSLGIIPGAGATYRLPRIIGLGRAKELIMTSRLVTADEALQMGLVNAVAADALQAAGELAKTLLAQSALALRFAKVALDTTAYAPIEVGMAYESAAQAVLFEDEEKHSRMQAFIDRPKVRGKR